MTDTDLFTTSDSDVAVAAQPVVETTDAPSTGATRGGRGGSLTSMLLPDLRALANEAGVKGTSGMRKSELISAIKEIRSGGGGTAAAADAAPAAKAASAPAAAADAPEQTERPRRERRGASRGTGAPAAAQEPASQDSAEAGQDTAPKQDAESKQDSAPKQDAEAKSQDAPAGDATPREEVKSGGQDKQDRAEGAGSGDQQQHGGQQNRNNQNRNNNRGDNNNRGENSNRGENNNRGDNSGDDDDDSRQGRRGRRFRDRRRRGERTGDGPGSSGGGGDRDTELREDDVVQPVAGILDVLDNYAFVRTSGYLAGPNDVYVSMNMVRKNGLRRGDAVTGAVRVAREGEGGGGNNPRQKFNPLVRLDTVNGGPVENAKNRPDFTKLTPLYPNQRLRLETTPERLTTRVIDLIMPIGKGQRALIVSPPKAGKTTIMQDIANAISTNNPECHLMVVLVDERPEEVTDMTRSVKGEVIASTFDRPPSDHTQAAELAIERAKRLVEQGKDVVVLLDSITRLGRAYNNASPASGRILSGGVDSTALYPPKRFLGAARNIEHGGSLTIIASALVETGSTGDTVIFEEFKGTGNAELKLDRKIAERRVFPAVDVNPSNTRKDELLMSSEEFAIVHKLRRVLSGLDSHQAIDLLMSQLRKTKTNYEFLVQVSKNAPGSNGDD
ncbi:transcription termination factor Rho [Mycolicibacterium fluoranthenivorans]|uniref:Transcription termination factor Rho n=1 Tax=Mycolicibacterium fluoranthenivorans TaxID=258505 RepID=A0A7G8PC72_9MYCO|nr:transcription termination factor Rho [Mycolicibacterium fluoranthenivorans]